MKNDPWVVVHICALSMWGATEGALQKEDYGSQFCLGYKARPCLKRQGWSEEEDGNKEKKTSQVHV